MTPGEALYSALAGVVPVPNTLEGMARLFSRRPQVANPALAIAMSGTDDKRSRDYRNALRSIQRWRTTSTERRRPPGADDPRMRRLRAAAGKRALERAIDRIRRRGCTATITGLVIVSADARYRDLGPQYIAPSRLRNTEMGSWFVLAGDAADAGRPRDNARDWELAGDAFQEAFFVSYGMPRYTRIDPVEDMRIDAG